MEIFLKEIKKILKEYGDVTLEVPPDQKMGDYAFPCFKICKKFRMSPADVAKQIASKLELTKYIEKIIATGPYVNFFVNKRILAEYVLTEVFRKKKRFGSKNKNHKIILVEYCGPNTNKPLHIGHLRNMAIGLAMCRIIAFQGFNVVPVNIVNDRGIHICKSMLAYQKWGDNKEPDKKGDHFVGDYYVLFAQKSKKDEALDSEAQQMLLRWEDKDPETRELWKKMNSWVLEGFQETYKRFGVAFEKEYFESEYYEKGKELAAKGVKQGVLIKDENGAIIAPLEPYKLTNKVVVRSDGSSVYITQDLYLANMRYEDYKFDKSIYVVASEQQLHFKQLFKILDLMGKPYAKNLYHLSYGMVHLPSGRMKSREGNVVDGDDLMDNLHKLAVGEIVIRHKDLTQEEVDRRAEQISLGALKFLMLHTDPIKDMVFDPEKSLSFEGETAPYIQYAHTRCCSILAKSDMPIDAVDFSIYQHQSEIKLIKLLDQFSFVVEDSVKHYTPHLIATFLMQLAQTFTDFYSNCPVNQAEPGIKQARLLLVDCVRQVLETGLDLLGIEAPEKM